MNAKTCRHALDALSVHEFTLDSRLRLYCARCNVTFVVQLARSASISVGTLRDLRSALPSQPTGGIHRHVEVTFA